MDDDDHYLIMIIQVRLPDSSEKTIEKDKAEYINPPKFDGAEDCAELSHLSEASVLYNLRKRYDADVIYVRSPLRHLNMI